MAIDFPTVRRELAAEQLPDVDLHPVDEEQVSGRRIELLAVTLELKTLGHAVLRFRRRSIEDGGPHAVDFRNVAAMRHA